MRYEYLVDAMGPDFFPLRGLGEMPPRGESRARVRLPACMHAFDVRDWLTLTHAHCSSTAHAHLPSPDPVIYRLYEAILVYGHPLKHLIHEKFGDGIMSAIDFVGDIERVENPQGDRVKITLEGKFLPYKRW